jgi:prepilin-type processing-associated H-X9-DG protein
MKIEGIKGCYEKTRGLFYFARMCSKLRLHADGKLPEDYFGMLGQGFDGRTCRYLSVRYEDVRAQVLAGRSDEEVLDWCLANGRQMMLAWRLYVDDNQDKVPQSFGPYEWVHGSLDFSPGNRSNWDLNRDIKKSLLWSYCGNNSDIWKCPADNSTVKVQGVNYRRVRSISMNAWFNSTDVDGFGPGFRQYKNMNDVIDPGPSHTWLFLDEREDSINDGEFVVGMNGYPDKPKQWMIVDFPASYHNRAAGFAFVDGHSEIKKWTDPRTTPVLKKGQELPLNVASPNNQDAFWMMDRSTRKK